MWSSHFSGELPLSSDSLNVWSCQFLLTNESFCHSDTKSDFLAAFPFFILVLDSLNRNEVHY